MKENKKEYESPYTKKTLVELESGLCATSHTGTPVVDDNNRKVTITEQEHGGWSGTGDDISTSWE